MDFDEIVHKVFYYGLIGWCILIIYLALGNGIAISLSFVEVPHVYTAAFSAPDWLLFSGLYVFFIFATVTTDDVQEHQVLSLLAFVSSLILWAWGLMDVLRSTTLETGSKLIAYTIASCGSGYYFIRSWRKR
jgi:hypothetical protein